MSQNGNRPNLNSNSNCNLNCTTGAQYAAGSGNSFRPSSSIAALNNTNGSTASNASELISLGVNTASNTCQSTNSLAASRKTSGGNLSASSAAHAEGYLPLDAQTFRCEMHHEDTFKSFTDFKSNSFLCDVEIIVDDRTFKCHRVVLAATIPYFRSMFSADMLETKQQKIIIKDISSEAMDSLLKYAYSAQIQLTTDNVQPLLYAGSILQMDSVCRACENFLTNYLSISNCLAIRSFAQQHNCVQLMRDVDSFSLDCFQQLMVTDEFLQISFSHLIDLITSADLNVALEVQVFEAVLLWIQHDIDSRLRYLPRLLSKVRLCQLDPGYLLNKVKSNRLIKDDPTCSDIVSNAMACQMVAMNIAPGRSSQVAPDVFACDFALCRPRKSVAGVIFCVGGRGTSGDPFRSIEVYDLRRNRWILAAEMGTKRRHVGVVSAKGKLYAIGGHDGNEHLSSAEVFDPSSNKWRIVAAMETHRRGIAVGCLGGAIYAVGGLDDTACFQTVERYDIEADQWGFVANMIVQRGGVGVTALKNHLYAVGGNDGTSSLDSCERYDPVLNKWMLVASMSHRRAGAGVVVLNGCLFAIGGFDDNSPLRSCERYNPNSNEWSLIPDMSCPRGGVGVASLGGKIYAVGGHDGVSYLNSVEAYDPLTNAWETVSPVSCSRAGAGVAWCDCLIDTLQPMSCVNVASCV